ncbi:MAG: ribonuclease Z [Lachnospiraceae bacterium]|nr:ribonuclease Z [Lachnospiraceae bacterium]
MILILVIDDYNGMMFNKRRQSQDQLLRERIFSITTGNKLWMNAYSYRQFKNMDGIHIVEAEDFLELAEPGEYCFVENISVKLYEEKIEKIILFRWNRKYPGDYFLDIDLSEKQWKLIQTDKFAGSSHEKITMEVYCHEHE